MIGRLARIHGEFGLGALARTIVLIVGLVALPLFGLLGFQSYWPAIVVAVGLVLGWLLRRWIVDRAEWFSWSMPAALFLYGVLLFLGEQLGLSRAAQVAFMALTTVIVFNIQFWSLSDPSIVRSDEDR